MLNLNVYLIFVYIEISFKRYMHDMLKFLINIIEAHWVGINIVSNSKTGLNHIDPYFGTKGTL